MGEESSRWLNPAVFLWNLLDACLGENWIFCLYGVLLTEGLVGLGFLNSGDKI